MFSIDWGSYNDEDFIFWAMVGIPTIPECINSK
jgi:hypothetical protein